ncbi:GNAT family N-acetyltransferase [Clostridium senegalense]|uniref:GNAT family N-acetyltransferase n=1 Tax=Clostridium senegalense TaxID=1465809 RepID=UPI000288BAB5|nr:GNAT family N-acetyltransferase [Clostridium senegalense]
MGKGIVRQGRYEDLDSVVALQQLWAKENITYGFVPIERDELEEKLGKYFWVYEFKNEILGFAYGTIHKGKNIAVIDDDEPYIEIEDIYIAAKNRGKGIGNALLDKLIEVAKENGVERSLLYSSSKDMDNIIKFYKKQYFKTWYVTMFR